MPRATSGAIKVKGVERLLENNAVTGSFDLDYDAYETWNLTLTGVTTFTESNLPATGVDTKVIVLNVTGNFTLNFPAGWSTNITGVYDGTTNNLIVVQYIKAGIYKVQITQPD